MRGSSPDAEARAVTLVSFIGIGGTSWIANMLRAHPELCLSEPKEVRYFNRHLLPIGVEKDCLNPQFRP